MLIHPTREQGGVAKAAPDGFDRGADVLPRPAVRADGWHACCAGRAGDDDDDKCLFDPQMGADTWLLVQVLTVDACQGSEFEYVLLSTVR